MCCRGEQDDAPDAAVPATHRVAADLSRRPTAGGDHLICLKRAEHMLAARGWSVDLLEPAFSSIGPPGATTPTDD